MKKNFQSTFILLAVLVGLSAWYVLYENKYKPAQAEKEENSKRIMSVDRDGVGEITIQQRQGDTKSNKYRTVRLKKVGTDWHLIEPIEDLAEQSAVIGLVSTFVDSKQDRVVEEKAANLETFGLTNPKIKISVKKDAGSPAHELWVGNDTPIGNSVYAKVVGKDPIYRGPQILRTSFDKDPSEYRSKKILTLNRPDIGELEIRTGTETVLLKNTEGDKWILTRDGTPASENEVTKTLNSVLEMRAIAFIDGKQDLGKWGLAPAAITMNIKKKNGESLTVLFGKQKDKYFTKKSDKGVIYEIPKDVFEKAGRSSKEYRDLKLAEFNRFDVKRIKVEHGPESFELVKDTTEWKLASDPATRIDGEKVDGYLTRLQDIKVVDFLKPSEKPKKADLVIHLFEKKGGKETEAVTIKAAKTGGKWTGERAGLDSAFSVSEPDFKKMNAFKQEFLASEKKVENKAGNGKS